MLSPDSAEKRRRLETSKGWYDQGLITTPEYSAHKKKILGIEAVEMSPASRRRFDEVLCSLIESRVFDVC